MYLWTTKLPGKFESHPGFGYGVGLPWRSSALSQCSLLLLL